MVEGNLSLSEISRYVPTENKSLEACVVCKLVLNKTQWERMNVRCPNCRRPVETTPDYIGMISIIMPQESWVARWNDIINVQPGVYAINVPQFEEDQE